MSENSQRGTFGSGRGQDLLKAEPLGRLARHDPSSAQAKPTVVADCGPGSYVSLYLAVALPLLALYSLCLRLAVWSWWCLRDRDILFVYSDSPVWHDYIEQRILPHLGERAIVLNWSERKRWRFPLKRMAFYHFGGDREFNPLAVVFRPFRRTRTFRFWQPFRDFKHGRPEELRKIEDEFFGLIGIERPDPPA